MSEKTELNEVQVSTDSFSTPANFDHVQRVAKAYSSSQIIPKQYQGNIPNTIIALEMSNRIGCTPIMVMQNLYVVHGNPSWSSTFIISAINSCGRFSPLRYEASGTGDEYGITAWANELATGERLDGVKVTWKMVKAEGWDAKNGSKWKTMPELMFRYRSATFFGRLYAPEILMGMKSSDEIEDIQYTDVTEPRKKEPSKPLITDDEIEMALEEKMTIQELETTYFISDEQKLKFG